MKALLYKDLVSSKSTYLLLLIMVGVIAGIAITQGAMIIIPFIFAYIPMILGAISFGYESQSEFPKFLFTTPISRTTYVKSKYCFSVLFGIMAFVSGLAVFGMEYGSLDFALIMASTSFAVPIIFVALQIPFVFEYGVEKEGIIMVATYAVLFITIRLVGKHLNRMMNLVQTMNRINSYLISVAIVAGAICILVVSIHMSCVIVKRKEY